MRVGLGTLVWALVVVGGASLVGRVVHVLSLDVEPPEPRPSPRPRAANIDMHTHAQHLMWFMQISDLHLSVFQDPQRSTQLREFAGHTVPIIKPAVVLASGDLTDAKTVDMLGSRQYIEEWVTYQDILRSSGVLNQTAWLDIRGNHDNFNVPSLSSDANFYQEYSVQGQKHLRSYMYTHRQGPDSVSFIAVDACLLPGPRRPFNFIGLLSNQELKLLQEFEEKSRESNHTIWFGHYPTSCILSPEPGIRRVMGTGLAYLCGHLHTLGGLAPNMYTRQHTGSLELELGDWKDGRYFRVAAIDHGLFSFTDVTHGTWPVILITNPKHALFAMPHHEPLHLMRESSHIRVLIWTPGDVDVARVRVDDAPWQPLTHVSGPLYVAPWTPADHHQGLHTITVVVRDSGGREGTTSQPFSLDNSQPAFSFWPRALLMSNVSMVFQFLFGVMVCLCVIPLCVLRYVHHLVMEGRLHRPRVRVRVCRAVLRKLWVLVSVDRLFWPLVFTALYMPLGPWFLGEVIEGHVGVVFAWGTFVNKSYLPGSLTYAYGFSQMLLFQLPLIFAVAQCIDSRFQNLYVQSTTGLYNYLCRHIWLLTVITIQMISAYFFFLAYGTMALILGPLRTWSGVAGLLLWYMAATAHKDTLRGAAVVWAPGGEGHKDDAPDQQEVKHDSQSSL